MRLTSCKSVTDTDQIQIQLQPLSRSPVVTSFMVSALLLLLNLTRTCFLFVPLKISMLVVLTISCFSESVFLPFQYLLSIYCSVEYTSLLIVLTIYFLYHVSTPPCWYHLLPISCSRVNTSLPVVLTVYFLFR